MATFYQRTLTIRGAQDSSFRQLTLQRESAASGDISNECFHSSSAALPASMDSALAIDFGQMGSAVYLYLEYTGENLRLSVTDPLSSKTLALDSGGTALSKVLILEGVNISAVTLQNIDGSNAGSYYLAMWGPASEGE